MAVSFAENCYFAGLKTLILLRFMIIQLFTRYRKLTTYVSAALEALGSVAFTFLCIIVIYMKYRNLSCEF